MASLSKKLLLGNQPYIKSRSRYKRVILTSQLSLLTFIICVLFFLIDLSSQTSFFALALQVGCATVALFSLFLNRNGNHTAAKVLLASGVNFTLYIFAEGEPLEIGLYMFFIVANVGTIVAFGYEEKRLAIPFILLSLALSIVSLFTEIEFFPTIVTSEKYTTINLMLNFLISFISSSLIIYFLINLNHRSEKNLLENEQQMILKNEELTKLNAELDKFMYSTSHDLRSPISSALGLIQLAKMTDDLVEIKTYMEMMEERLASLNKFIKDISDYSRNARTEVNRESLSVNKVMHGIVDNLKFYPGAEKVDVRVMVNPELSIRTDPTRFHVIFSNLISNSFKYVDRYKENPFIRVSADTHNDRIHFRVEDNGVGIADKYLPRIFEMFFQAHEKSEGSGLGLYIVKEAVAKLEGTIVVKSRLEMGTVFEVTLPK
ncbi:hypothetical protein BH09BAC3_BH09BAC3_32340 [soil metagenome]